MQLLILAALICLAFGDSRRLIKAPHITPRVPLSLQASSKLNAALFPGNDTWKAGYVTFPAESTNFHFFYWMAYSRSNPATDPVIFWFTGGPGCSSQLALLAENGPWQFADPSNQNSIRVNPYSWNNKATVVWIDQPVGTGFSYADHDVYERNEDEVAADVFAFTQGFYKKYPQLQKLPLFITGESYGGHYVPAISNKIVTENQVNKAGIPFAGASVGNGLVDPRSQYPQYANFSYMNNLISKAQMDKYAIEIKPCLAALAVGAYETAYALCNGVMQGILSASGIQNVYNIKAGCPVPPLCYDFSGATAFLNSAAVQTALGIPNGLQWQSCNYDVNSQFSRDWMHSMATRLLNVLAANKTVLIYSGKWDYICNYVGGAAWTRNLVWPGQAGFNNAPRTSWDITLANGTAYHAGTAQVYQNFAWLEVEAAGHMVPMDQPQAALNMINRFISQGWRGSQ